MHHKRHSKCRVAARHYRHIEDAGYLECQHDSAGVGHKQHADGLS